MTISSIFILDQKGKIIIHRDYRGDVKLTCVDRFVAHILEEDEVNVKPVFEDDGISFMYIKHEDIYLLAVSRRNTDATLALLFLYKLVGVFEEYFERLEEESIRDNFVITYELLDEMVDYGYPQTTEAKVLKQYITQEGQKLHKAQVHIPENVTSKFPWRPSGIVHRRNEVFLDVIEKVNLMIGSNGQVIKSEIEGAIKIKSCLSGMPELRLGLNDKLQLMAGDRQNRSQKNIEMEDVVFHQCVSLTRFDSDRIISFVPPDGDFELLSYRLTTNVKPLFWIEAIVESHAHSRIEYLIKARSQFKLRSVANDVQIKIPVPPNADSPKFKQSIGTCVYAPDQDCIIWTIKQFTGGKEFLMRAHFGLPSVTDGDDEEGKQKPPITITFEIPYFTVSGIQVRYLKILERTERYTALPWVRYITRAGDYQIRT
jgi:AP-1 complex subunit mu